MERRSSSAADELRRIARSDRATRRVPYQPESDENGRVTSTGATARKGRRKKVNKALANYRTK